MRAIPGVADAQPVVQDDAVVSDKAGTGSLTLTGGQAPGTVTMRLDMREPLAGSNEIVFALVPQGPQGEATEVSWTMRGASPFVARLIGVVFDMDAMIGRDFAAGLADLKALAERR